MEELCGVIGERREKGKARTELMNGLLFCERPKITRKFVFRFNTDSLPLLILFLRLSLSLSLSHIQIAVQSDNLK